MRLVEDEVHLLHAPLVPQPVAVLVAPAVDVPDVDVRLALDLRGAKRGGGSARARERRRRARARGACTDHERVGPRDGHAAESVLGSERRERVAHLERPALVGAQELRRVERRKAQLLAAEEEVGAAALDKVTCVEGEEWVDISEVRYRRRKEERCVPAFEVAEGESEKWCWSAEGMFEERVRVREAEQEAVDERSSELMILEKSPASTQAWIRRRAGEGPGADSGDPAQVKVRDELLKGSGNR